MSALPPRASLRPQFTVVMLYLFGFFFVFALALALPALIRTFLSLPPEAQQDLELAKRVTRDALRERLPLACGAAVLATGLGAWSRRLPGLRSLRARAGS